MQLPFHIQTTAGLIQSHVIPIHNAYVWLVGFLHKYDLELKSCLCIQYVCALKEFVLTYID